MRAGFWLYIFEIGFAERIAQLPEKMKISYLADHKDVIPTLSDWFYREWSYIYHDKTAKDVEKAISKRTNKFSVPLTLVAFEDSELIGTVCLKQYDMNTRPELTPWLAGLYVKESWRKKGIGSQLVKAIENKASELDVKRLFLYTPESDSFYLKLGWNIMRKENYRNVPVTIMEKRIR